MAKDPLSRRTECDVRLDLERPFARSDGLRAGLTERLLDGQAFHQVFPGVRVRADTPLDDLTLARAVLVLCPEAIVSHHTAARLWGGVVPHNPDVHVTVGARGARPRHQGVHAHHTKYLPTSRQLHGLPLTSPERTFVDLAGQLGLVGSVTLADAMVASGSTSPDRLIMMANSWSGAGVRMARRAAALARPRVESPRESMLRILLVCAGLPEPKINVPVRSACGRRRYRLDLAYPEARVVVEYDGRQHAESSAQWQHDIARREDLDVLGWRLIVVRNDDITRRPAVTVERVRSALVDRGAPTGRRVPESTWGRLFPSR